LHKDDRSHRSHATAWVAAVLAIPLLYLISVPPVCIMTQVWGKAPPIDPFAPPDYQKSTYYKPYRWLHDNTPLQSGLAEYERIWSNLL
jgi:hypothetical protein